MKSSADGLSRIERLNSLDGSNARVAIVFLLREKKVDSENDGDGMTAYMELQAKYVHLQICQLPLIAISATRLLTLSLLLQIIPLPSVVALPSTLWSFARQLMAPRLTPPIVDPVTDILPYCTAGGVQQRQLPEHARNVLSDIVHSLRDLAAAATTPDGQVVLRQWLSDGTGNSRGSRVAEEVIEFWQVEYIVQ